MRKNMCSLCGSTSLIISRSVNICKPCVLKGGSEFLDKVHSEHSRVRARYGLPASPPRTTSGIPCTLCSNQCRIGVGEVGYCGLRTNIKGRLSSLVSPKRGLYYTYLDPHVTNCCAAWYCPAGTGAGYPKYAYKEGPETGYSNLAIFFYGCNFDCLFCQNFSHKELWREKPRHVDELLDATLRNRKISCWCFFGGSPEPQLPFAVNASRRIIEEKPKERIMRICFEWNGCGNSSLVKRAAEIVWTTGGTIKFDLKCWSEGLSVALSGVSNRRAYENFEMIGRSFALEHDRVTMLTATTLLLPGYVDEEEVENITKFIASINPNIPYSLLIFHPDFEMTDLPVTSSKQAVACYETAKRHLKRVTVGNLPTIGCSTVDELVSSTPS